MRQQAEERKARQKAEAEEVIRMEREYAAALQKNEQDRHAAFRKVLARQEARQNAYVANAQEQQKRQQLADEARAEEHRKEAEAWAAATAAKAEARRAATRAQVGCVFVCWGWDIVCMF